MCKRHKYIYMCVQEAVKGRRGDAYSGRRGENGAKDAGRGSGGGGGVLGTKKMIEIEG